MEGRPRDERELARRAKRGDAQAFEQLVEPHREIAFRVAYLITRNSTEAEEAAQEALLKLWRTIARFRTGAPLRPWLLTITANEARNRRRSGASFERLMVRAAAALPTNDSVCSLHSRRCRSRPDWCSSAATCSSSPKKRQLPHSASAAARSSHVPPARLND